MNMKYIQVLLVLSLVPRYYIVHSYARLCTQKQMCSYMCYVPAKLPGDPRENHKYEFLNQRWQSLEKIFLLPSRNKWYFVTKIVLTYCEKKTVLVTEKNF